jgi:hypothetical protein
MPAKWNPAKYKDLQIWSRNMPILYKSCALRNLINLQTYKTNIFSSLGNQMDRTVHYNCHKKLHQFGTGFSQQKNKTSDDWPSLHSELYNKMWGSQF